MVVCNSGIQYTLGWPDNGATRQGRADQVSASGSEWHSAQSCMAHLRVKKGDRHAHPGNGIIPACCALLCVRFTRHMAAPSPRHGLGARGGRRDQAARPVSETCQRCLRGTRIGAKTGSGLGRARHRAGEDQGTGHRARGTGHGHATCARLAATNEPLVGQGTSWSCPPAQRPGRPKPPAPAMAHLPVERPVRPMPQDGARASGTDPARLAQSACLPPAARAASTTPSLSRT